jgi:aryl-alcohol dehydrogenase-like predicted oxidoreductase
MQYSLAVRNIENEYVDAAQEMGIGIVPWSALANGLLTGKYKIEGDQVKGDGRVSSTWVTDPTIEPASATMVHLVEVLKAVAKELGRTPAQVALNWVTNRPGVVSTIIGATKLSQLEDNIQALEFTIPEEQLKKLDEASSQKVVYPYFFHSGALQENVRAVTKVTKTPRGYHSR